MSTTLTKELSEVEHLEAVLSSLKLYEDRVYASGEVAPSYVWIDKSFVKGKQYARLRSDRPLPEWGNKKLRHLGRVGCPEHRDWAARVARRKALQDIAQRAMLAQKLIDAYRYSLWEPPAEDSLNELDWVEQGDRVTVQGQDLTVDAIGVRHIRLVDEQGKPWFYNKESGQLGKKPTCHQSWLLANGDRQHSSTHQVSI